jgi:acyl-CoA reductase-like NAD-dependent aldehyde dehydrogenase
MATTTTRTFSMLIDGGLHEIGGGGVAALVDPSTGLEIGSAPLGSPADVDRAVAAARRAFAGAWGDTAPVDRGRLMFRLAAAIREHADELAELVMRYTGHPPAFARTDAANAARYFEYYGGLADKIHGESIPLGEGYVDYTVREPWGVCAVITPFNGPLQMLGRSSAPALAAGNTVVLKPTEQAPAAVLALAEVLHAAGLPPGVLNVVPGAADAGQHLVGHPDVAHVTFTGSVATGTAIMTAAAQQITPVTLELGGKSPQVIFADADLAAASRAIVASALVTAGQVCFAGTRVLVERTAHAALLERLTQDIGQVKVGPPSEGCDMGPVISAAQRDRIRTAIERAQADGARLVIGGAEPPEGVPEGGFFVRPTVFDGVDPHGTLAKEEIFGPVLAVIPFDTWPEALELANDSEYGLAAGVWTRDLGRAHHFGRKLEAGQVYVNNYGATGGIELPFGGYKKSGIGREKGTAAIDEYTQTKNVCVLVSP